MSLKACRKVCSMPTSRVHICPGMDRDPQTQVGEDFPSAGLQWSALRCPYPGFDGVPKAFRPGIPALDAFPFEIWSKLTSQHLHRPIRYLLGYGEPAGYRPLREAIAAYVGAARAVRCSPDQVIMVTGSQQAVDLVARVLLQPGR